MRSPGAAALERRGAVAAPRALAAGAAASSAACRLAEPVILGRGRGLDVPPHHAPGIAAALHARRDRRRSARAALRAAGVARVFAPPATAARTVCPAHSARCGASAASACSPHPQRAACAGTLLDRRRARRRPSRRRRPCARCARARRPAVAATSRSILSVSSSTSGSPAATASPSFFSHFATRASTIDSPTSGTTIFTGISDLYATPQLDLGGSNAQSKQAPQVRRFSYLPFPISIRCGSPLSLRAGERGVLLRLLRRLRSAAGRGAERLVDEDLLVGRVAGRRSLGRARAARPRDAAHGAAAGRSIRCGRMKSHAPMFSGSSWTQTISSALG